MRSLLPCSCRTLFGLAALVGPALLAGTGVWAQTPAVTLLNSIPIPVAGNNTTSNGLYSWDISYIDQVTHQFYVADRSNRAVDQVDTTTETFVRQLTANPPFAGFAGSTAKSGPNGVIAFGPFLFVSDAPSRVVTINLSTGATVGDVKTDPTSPFRADEMAGDPRDKVLLAINNADTPPFGTLISVNPATGGLTVGTRITFDKAHGVDAQNGAEQPVWEPFTGKFYLSIPQIGTDPAIGGVVRIDPITGNVDAVYPIAFCSPAGLTVGPNQNLLVGCNLVFDVAGNVWNSLDPNTAAPIQVIFNARTGMVDTVVPGVGAGDEVWYNPGDNTYYTASSGSPLVPGSIVSGSPNVSQGAGILGVIDAEDKVLLQLVPTLNVPAVPGNPLRPAGTAHSVAASSATNHVFVTLASNNVFPSCLTGCVAVFGRAPIPEDEPRRAH